MEYLCGVTRKNCYFLFYKQIIENKWSNYPEINRKDLKFSLDDHASFLKNKVDAVDLSPQEFFAEIL